MRFTRFVAALFVFLAAIALRGGQVSNADPSRTPQRLARGKYLVNLAHCFDCHSERDAKGNQTVGMEGAGRVLPPEESNIPRPHFLVCPNITPDRETGAGSWSDAQLARALRKGIGNDGRILDKTMPYWNFRYLTDEDLASIIVFLRSIPAVHHPLPKRDLAGQPVTDWRPEVQPPALPQAHRQLHAAANTWCTSAPAPGATPPPIRRVGLCRACCSPAVECSSARGAPSPART
jgi:hypothetical protein